MIKSSRRSKFCNIHVISARPATTDCYLVWRNTVFIELVRSQKSCRYYLEWSHSMGGGGGGERNHYDAKHTNLIWRYHLRSQKHLVTNGVTCELIGYLQ